MTTSFQAPTGAADGGAAKPTSFQVPGDAGNPAAGGDSTVVFEHGGRKYTAADLVKKIDNADTFIETLKSESQQTRDLLKQANDALGKTVSAAELLKQIQAGGVAAPAAAATPAAAAEASTPVTAEQVADLVLQRQGAATAAAQAKTNFAEVQAQLSKVYGAKVDAKVDELCAASGLSREQAVTLASQSPKAFLKLFPEVNAAPPRSFAQQGSVNTQALHGDPAARKVSGYTTAASEKARTAIYLQRLAEAGV